jgi:hypothetical protein
MIVLSMLNSTKFQKYWQKTCLILAIFFSSLTILVTILHYKNNLTANYTLWLFWALSMLTFLSAYAPNCSKIKCFWAYKKNKTSYLIIIVTSILYFFIRVYAYKFSPLNNYGISDDAAWDIYFAKKFILLSDGAFQPSFLDDFGLSRESLYHYYILGLFKIWGYNLLTFNMGLFFLGYISVLFTTLTIQLLFNRWWITIIGALIILTFPLHVTQTFNGHRYAIALPLIMMSYYFLLSGFNYQSKFKLCLAGILCGLGICGAPMVKQFLLAILIGLLLYAIIDPKRTVYNKNNVSLVFVSITGLFISLIPLLIYIYFISPDKYLARETQLLTIHMWSDYQQNGLSSLISNIDRIFDVFFYHSSFLRRFMGDYPLIPYAYWIALIPGLILSLLKRNWVMLIMCLLPTFVGFLTEPFDFRLQISTPFWIIAMLYTVNIIADNTKAFNLKTRILSLTVICSIAVGLLSSTLYLKKTYSINNENFFPMQENDLAFARMAQDIALGNIENPSIEMKPNEFNPVISINQNVLVCPYYATSYSHLFFQNFNELEVLALCDGFANPLGSTSKIFSNIRNYLMQYKNNGKDLIMIWEATDNMQPIINRLSQFEKYGYANTFHYKCETIFCARVANPELNIAVWLLKINKENVGIFLAEMKSLEL